MDQKELLKMQKAAEKRDRILKIMCFPIMFILGVIPLIVRFHKLSYDQNEIYGALGKTEIYDFFAQSKAAAIIICTVIMLLMIFFFMEKKMLRGNAIVKLYVIATGIYILFAIISTVMSKYKQVAVWGIYDNAEGLIITLCYLIMAFYTYYIMSNSDCYQYIFGAILFLMAAETIFGIFEYNGYNLFNNVKFFKDMMISKQYAEYRDQFTLSHDIKNIGLTMYHYNYVGSFAAMMVPLFATLTILTEIWYKRVIFGVAACAGIFILLACGSRAGIVGTVLAVIVALIIFGKIEVKKWKITVPVAMGLIVLALILGKITNFTIIDRLPSLMQDITAVFSKDGKTIDYKSELPINNISTEDGKVSFTMANGSIINFSYVDGEIKTTDNEGKEVEFVEPVSIDTDGQQVDEEAYETTDPRFAGFQYLRQMINVTSQPDPIDSVLITFNKVAAFKFKVTSQGLISINEISGLEEPIVEADSIGFKGKEKVGSARGYIWSRTLAMIAKNNLLVGNGAETYAMVFPQNDLLAKWYAYGTTEMVISNPHNLYLQIASNYGCIALVAFLIIVMTYIVSSIKLYAFRGDYARTYAAGTAIMLAVIGYLGAGFFNISTISVAPVFWVLLGMGIGINYMNSKHL